MKKIAYLFGLLFIGQPALSMDEIPNWFIDTYRDETDDDPQVRVPKIITHQTGFYVVFDNYIGNYYKKSSELFFKKEAKLNFHEKHIETPKDSECYRGGCRIFLKDNHLYFDESKFINLNNDWARFSWVYSIEGAGWLLLSTRNHEYLLVIDFPDQ